MQRFLLLHLLLLVSGVNAATTDYSCNFIGPNGKLILSATAKVSSPGTDGNNEFGMLVSNISGYVLTVSVYDKIAKSWLLNGEYELAGNGFIDGDLKKGRRSDSNPLNIKFSSTNSDYFVNCNRK